MIPACLSQAQIKPRAIKLMQDSTGNDNVGNIDDLKRFADMTNIADALTEEDLDDWGNELVDGVKEDLNSRSDWEKRNMDWIRLATQVVEKKSTPWPNASNVKFPALTLASLNFQARAIPMLIPGNDLVKSIVIGSDLDGSKENSAIRVSKYMSYQCKYKMESWEPEMDRGLFVLPFGGTFFKKIFYDPIDETTRSDLVLPSDLIINYYAKSLSQAARVTHRLYFTGNEIEAQERAGVWSEVDIGEPDTKELKGTDPKVQRINPPSKVDGATPYEIYECHCWKDLDGDGYEEPYIVTLHAMNGKVLRVAPRYDFEEEKCIILSDDGNKVIRINPIEFFVDYIFLPDPYSGIYGLGWGALVGPMNDSIDTLINQIIDAGTLNNTNGGLIGKGVKILGGDLKFRPGEWKIAAFTGDDINKHIAKLPTNEPSLALLQLLQLLISSTEKLASTMDIMTGEMPGQNTKATVVMQAIEQGGKIYSAIYKRLHKSLTKEFRLLYKLNAKYLPAEEYFIILDGDKSNSAEIRKSDFDAKAVNIIPTADPTISSQAQKIAKTQALLEISQIRRLNPDVIARRMLEATEQSGIEELMNVPAPGPPLEVQLAQMDLDVKMKIHADEMTMRDRELSVEIEKVQTAGLVAETNALLNIAKAEALGNDHQIKQAQVMFEHVKNVNENIQKRLELKLKKEELSKAEKPSANSNS